MVGQVYVERVLHPSAGRLLHDRHACGLRAVVGPLSVDFAVAIVMAAGIGAWWKPVMTGECRV